jgi:hypothetical protein
MRGCERWRCTSSLTKSNTASEVRGTLPELFFEAA